MREISLVTRRDELKGAMSAALIEVVKSSVDESLLIVRKKVRVLDVI